MDRDNHVIESMDLLYELDSDAYVKMCFDLTHSGRLRFSGVLGSYIRITLDDICVAVVYHDEDADEICGLVDSRMNVGRNFDNFLEELSSVMSYVLRGDDVDEYHIQITNNVVSFFMKGDDKLSDDTYRIGDGSIVSANEYKIVISCELLVSSETYIGHINEYPECFELIYFMCSPGEDDDNPNEPIYKQVKKLRI